MTIPIIFLNRLRNSMCQVFNLYLFYYIFYLILFCLLLLYYFLCTAILAIFATTDALVPKPEPVHLLGQRWFILQIPLISQSTNNVIFWKKNQHWSVVCYNIFFFFETFNGPKWVNRFDRRSKFVSCTKFHTNAKSDSWCNSRNPGGYGWWVLILYCRA